MTCERRNSVCATPASSQKSLSDPSSTFIKAVLMYISCKISCWISLKGKEGSGTKKLYLLCSSRCSRWAWTVPSLSRVLFSHWLHVTSETQVESFRKLLDPLSVFQWYLVLYRSRRLALCEDFTWVLSLFVEDMAKFLIDFEKKSLSISFMHSFFDQIAKAQS
ncbi:hypothetical protein NA56DRAFT_242093 [Hyaloscypha hepaticicola]|uniref:Uncharacterized protein n=1 Tax=Hyaloscypha hepaticicola TaxID=2082293 RepID=A0A2J6PXA1_9HELO|nr:hypothetical protein NA56DRAFT_242093 [Hyaloscypha hepaticicola]